MSILVCYVAINPSEEQTTFVINIIPLTFPPYGWRCYVPSRNADSAYRTAI